MSSSSPALTAAETLQRTAAQLERTRQLQKAAAEADKFQMDVRNASAAKMARLRDLRLAKEAEESAAKALRKAARGAKPKRARKVAAPVDAVVSPHAIPSEPD